MVLAKARQGRSKSTSQGVRTQITRSFAPTLIHKPSPDGHTVQDSLESRSPQSRATLHTGDRGYEGDWHNQTGLARLHPWATKAEEQRSIERGSSAGVQVIGKSICTHPFSLAAAHDAAMEENDKPRSSQNSGSPALQRHILGCC